MTSATLWKKGSDCVEGRYLEHHGATNKTEMKYEISRKKTLFYKESVVYPLVSFREEIKSNQKHFIFIKKVEYVDVVEYVNHYGMSIFT